ncbi:MAG: epoxyqueuosine reductase QueH [Clostridiales bacterium]|nr:epoxyqueuosine reductase QueH [Clostridiales bacterium]
MEQKPSKKRILLHSCCGPCSSAVIERLAPDYEISLFYYNPNITDRAEYEHRLAEQKRLIDLIAGEIYVEFVEGEYEPSKFYDCAKGLESEPEGGRRCEECFKLRLSETARAAAEGGYDCFDSTLSVSPHKDYRTLFRIGKELAEECGVEFLAGDYKKRDGYLRSVRLAKKYELYRQNYCGCKFSRIQKRPERRELLEDSHV